MFQTEVVQKIKTHILCSVTLFFRKPCLLWDVKKYWKRGRLQITIWRIRIACWIPKATNTHSGCVKLFAFPLQQLLHERPSLLRFTYIACTVFYFFSPTSISILQEYVSIYTYLTAQRLYRNYRCYQITQQWNIFTQIRNGAKCYFQTFILIAFLEKAFIKNIT